MTKQTIPPFACSGALQATPESNPTRRSPEPLRAMHATGAIDSRPADVEALPHMILTLGKGAESALPDRIELRAGLPPVRDQGAQGSCVGWASAYYCYSYAVGKQLGATAAQMRTPEYQFSPAYVFNRRPRRGIAGMSIAEAITLLRDGCAKLVDFPYDATRESPVPGRLRESAEAFALETGYVVWHRNSPKPSRLELDAIRLYLAEQRLPMVVGMLVAPSFHAASGNRIYPGPTAREMDRMRTEPRAKRRSGLHAMALVGYDRKRSSFLLVNSWGDRWGDRGFLWVDEAYVTACLNEVWAILPGGPTILGRGDFPLPRSINRRGDVRLDLGRSVTKSGVRAT